VKEAALQLGIPVYEPKSLRDFARQNANDNYDLFVLASYGRILPQDLLDLPKLGALNVHPSLLPKYRGATPIQTALLNGDGETGVTIMLMDAGMDTGDVVHEDERSRIDIGGIVRHEDRTKPTRIERWRRRVWWKTASL